MSFGTLRIAGFMMHSFTVRLTYKITLSYFLLQNVKFVFILQIGRHKSFSSSAKIHFYKKKIIANKLNRRYQSIGKVSHTQELVLVIFTIKNKLINKNYFKNNHEKLLKFIFCAYLRKVSQCTEGYFLKISSVKLQSAVNRFFS